MRQRIMIAMALALEPALLIADEPTTALDVTVQAQIMELLKDLQREMGMGLVLITHDLGVVADMADRIVVMYAGKAVEVSPVYELYSSPAHPYTAGLLQSIPRLDSAEEELRPIGGAPPDMTTLPAGCPFEPRCRWAQHICKSEPPALRQLADGRQSACHFADAVIGVRCSVSETGAILEAANVSKAYPVRQGVLFGRGAEALQAVDDVSFSLSQGEALGIVGESGCGKSTLARVLMGLEKPTGGEVRFHRPQLFAARPPKELCEVRRHIQIVRDRTRTLRSIRG